MSDQNFDVATISKAIAGGLAGLVLTELAHYGFHPSLVFTDFLGVFATGLVGYVVAHLIVFNAPANK